jgi:hypothetical protein
VVGTRAERNVEEFDLRIIYLDEILQRVNMPSHKWEVSIFHLDQRHSALTCFM